MWIDGKNYPRSRHGVRAWNAWRRRTNNYRTDRELAGRLCGLNRYGLGVQTAAEFALLPVLESTGRHKRAAFTAAGSAARCAGWRPITALPNYLPAGDKYRPHVPAQTIAG